MKQRSVELRAGGKKGAKKADALQAARESIAAMALDDRTLAERVHATVTSTAPELSPKTWYGMPAFANEDGKVVVFFKDAGKFKSRYARVRGGREPRRRSDVADVVRAHGVDPGRREEGRRAGEGRRRVAGRRRLEPQKSYVLCRDREAIRAPYPQRWFVADGRTREPPALRQDAIRAQLMQGPAWVSSCAGLS